MRLIMASIGLSRTQLSTSGLQVGDLKASVTPSLHRCCVDVSVSCSCAHLQGQHECAFETAPVAFPRPEGVRGNAPSPARTGRTAAPKAVHDCGLGRIGLFSETYNHLTSGPSRMMSMLLCLLRTCLLALKRSRGGDDEVDVASKSDDLSRAAPLCFFRPIYIGGTRLALVSRTQTST